MRDISLLLILSSVVLLKTCASFSIPSPSITSSVVASVIKTRKHKDFTTIEGFQKDTFWNRKRHHLLTLSAGVSMKEEGINGGIHPNWRVWRRAFFNQEDDAQMLSPFTHTSSSPPSAATWSKEQYEESLFLYQQFSSCTDAYLSPLIKDALHTLENAYRLYGPLNVIGSYNGGKDAVVILHLMRAAHAKHCSEHYSSSPKSIPRPRVIYFEHEDEFLEILTLLNETVSKFDLDMLAFEQGIKFGEGLSELVTKNYHNRCDAGTASSPFPMAFVLGTRKADPNAGSQGKFAPSSHYMPPFMRINPVVEWEYGHVWHFLRLFQLPYCSLYDEGYTSLGTVHDTIPCPALAKASIGKGQEYFPAYMLRDWDQERAGRIVVPKPKTTANSPSKTGTTTPNITISQSSSVVSLDEKAQSSSSVEPQSDNNNTSNIDDADLSIDSDATTLQKTVGLIIIGDEILKGLVTDANTHAAAIALREKNVPLSRVVVCSDNHDDIVEEIQRMFSEVDVIVTSGGVGPTHDDVTIKSVSTALGREMIFHEEMSKLLQEKMTFGDDDDDGKEEKMTEAQIKMATLPESSKLRYLSKSEEWPVLQCHNIFVLPGVPQFFESKIKALAEYLSSDHIEKSEVFKVVLSIGETSIVNILNQVVSEHPHVSFGSYPFVGHPQYKTVVTLEGKAIDDGTIGGAIGDGNGRMSQRALLRRMSSSKARSSLSLSMTSTETVLFTKEEMDVHVRLALADLVNGMPEGSVLRVDNNDDLAF
mmetsp:Transcript_8791/g.11764  ORF Transcript_8791/g.11764 Transcript_8791/m.11764 type:complete len:759 (-) Transcript_8791:279-2555(-)